MAYRYDNAASVRGLVLRVTRLDVDGSPRVGGSGCDVYISTGFVSFTFTPAYNESDEISITNASGEVCVYYKAPDTLQSVEFGLELCDPDPILTEMLVGGNALSIADGEDTRVVGYAAPRVGSAGNTYGVAVEVWTQAVIGGKSANSMPYWHYLFPFATFRMDGERVLENGNTATVFAGNGSGNDNFGAGPDIDTTGISPAVTADTFAWTFPEFADRPFAYARANNAPIGLTGCFANTGTVVLDPATSAVAGVPGTFNGAAPANLASASTVDATPSAAWTSGQYVVLADGSSAHWNGTAWAAGVA